MTDDLLFYSSPVNSVLELIGNTPIVRINKLIEPGQAEVYAKVELFNPCKSVKDRICLSMIEAAEGEGKLKSGDTVIEPTSGNTGIGLAFVCAVKGYDIKLTMPDTMSIERRNMLKAFGAEVILTDGEKNMNGAIDKAMNLVESMGYFQPQQFKNPNNPKAHREATALEIIEQTGQPDVFIAGVGTGGTLTGVGEILRERYGEKVEIIAVEPSDSPVLSGGSGNRHEIQGIGAGFVPDILNKEIIDRIITVSNEDAYETTRKLIKEEGILCGISSGANMYAALKVAGEPGNNKKIVTLFPDTGERYLSTRLFVKKQTNGH